MRLVFCSAAYKGKGACLYSRALPDVRGPRNRRECLLYAVDAVGSGGSAEPYWVFYHCSGHSGGCGGPFVQFYKDRKIPEADLLNQSQAAELSGISVSKYKTIAFVLSGLTLGIAACLTVVRSPNIVSSIGTNLETNVLLALSLGGMSMTGIFIKMRSAVIGTLIFYILNNGLTLWGLDANYVDIVKAAFFLFTVTISIDRSQYEVIV